MIVNNVIALGSSIVFARLINGPTAPLAALVSYLLILTVALRPCRWTTAREGVLGHLGVGEDLLTSRWSAAGARSMAVFTLAATRVVSILLRQPIADLVGVQARRLGRGRRGSRRFACTLECRILRGALQAIGDYKKRRPQP